MTIEQANAYFASLPEGFAPARQLQEALSAKAGRVDYLGVAGTCLLYTSPSPRDS